MFEIVYAKSVEKDVRKIARTKLLKIKQAIEELKNFPDLLHIKSLTNHPIAEYRLRIGNYRVLFDVDWESKQIHILKIGHRKDIY